MPDSPVFLSQDSFCKAQQWLKDLEEEFHPGEVVVVLVGNKTDLHQERQVTFEVGLETVFMSLVGEWGGTPNTHAHLPTHSYTHTPHTRTHTHTTLVSLLGKGFWSLLGRSDPETVSPGSGESCQHHCSLPRAGRGGRSAGNGFREETTTLPTLSPSVSDAGFRSFSLCSINCSRRGKSKCFARK